ncbi:MAG: transglycosylase SLT domain-containing protein [Burkholderiaceae bacterium]
MPLQVFAVFKFPTVAHKNSLAPDSENMDCSLVSNHFDNRSDKTFAPFLRRFLYRNTDRNPANYVFIITAIVFSVLATTLATTVSAEKLFPPAPKLSVQDQAFKDAFDAMEQKNWANFRKAAAKVSQKYVLRDYIDYWQLRHELNEADAPSDKLDARVRRFINTNPTGMTADLLRKKWMLELGKRENWAELLTHLPKWRRRNDTRVFCYAGRARLALGQPVGEQATNALQRDRNLGEECGPLAAELHRAGVLDEETLRRRMWRALEVRDWRSVQTLAELLGAEPEQIAESLRKSTDTLRQFEAMPDKPKQALTSNQRDELLIALVRLSRSHPVDTAQWMQALEIKLRQVERQFVWAQIAASAMRDMIPEAYEYSLKASGAPITDVTRQWLARAALRQHDWRFLLQVIGEMASTTQSQATWIFWRARAMTELGEKFGAQALLRKIAGGHHFYGELAAEELGDLIDQQKPDLRPAEKSITAMGRKRGFIRAQKFYTLGIRYQGNREWDYQARGMSDYDILAAARFACRQQLLERCISMANRTRERHDFSLRFISPFRQSLAPVAARHGLDLSWVYGLIRQESRFTADARSSAGARGLMQIMPATGRWIARKMGVKGFKSQHLFEPETNLSFGAYYLKAVYDDLHNSPLLASAAYNAGPKRPRHWISTLPRDVDGALFVEIIPFSQTRTYVKKVLLNTAYYESVFSGRPQSLKSLLGQVPLVPYSKTAIP